MNVDLILSNKPSKINKKMIEFLNANLYNINKANIKLNFQVADAENKEYYYKKNITNFPVLVHGGNNIVGIEKIMNHLKMTVIKYNKTILNKSDDDKVRDFWKETMGNCKKDENGVFKFDDEVDESVNEERDLQHKIQKAFEKRNNSDESKPSMSSDEKSASSNLSRKSELSRGNNMDETPSQTLKNMGSGDIDDNLMAKFFENQEESL
jgi:hypothetical protein